MAITENFNLLAPTGFKLTINRDKFANTEFFITSFQLPGLNLGETAVNYKNAFGYAAGETLAFDAITLRLAVDEDMKSYTEIVNWMIDNETKLTVNDMILSVLTNSAAPNKEIQITNAFPTSVSGVDFNTNATDITYVQVDVTFRYDRFNIIK